MVHGPQAGLGLLTALDDDARMSRHHRLQAVRAHLLEMAGERAAARSCYLRAAQLSVSLLERRYLQHRAAQLADSGQPRLPGWRRFGEWRRLRM